MTTPHQHTIPSQAAFPRVQPSRRRWCDLPEPGERRRLREQWGLSIRQVATAFGVTPATVRSWEYGRSAPRGSRKEAYQRFLAGLAEHGGMGQAQRHGAWRRRRSAPGRTPPTTGAGAGPHPGGRPGTDPLAPACVRSPPRRHREDRWYTASAKRPPTTDPVRLAHPLPRPSGPGLADLPAGPGRRPQLRTPGAPGHRLAAAPRRSGLPDPGSCC
ncbi:helix-turn-helix transcriptional regulator [Streptomyces sp. 2132.2]|uniref:helix-turn-helix domain-containing protein n=1 Tax=Streptomyces sp. 2132.2 TaxID=2485161 RepID=UPI00288A44BC|nr:helix-turn-helix transcriptional regulator [Streptomyces sp. 2132.2]